MTPERFNHYANRLITAVVAISLALLGWAYVMTRKP